jgi:hypothetical protein
MLYHAQIEVLEYKMSYLPIIRSFRVPSDMYS